MAASLKTPAFVGAVAQISAALESATAKALFVVKKGRRVQEATARAAFSILEASAPSLCCFFLALSPFPGLRAGARFRGASTE